MISNQLRSLKNLHYFFMGSRKNKDIFPFIKPTGKSYDIFFNTQIKKDLFSCWTHKKKAKKKIKSCLLHVKAEDKVGDLDSFQPFFSFFLLKNSKIWQCIGLQTETFIFSKPTNVTLHCSTATRNAFLGNSLGKDKVKIHDEQKKDA